MTDLPNRARQLFLFSDVYHDPLMATSMPSHHSSYGTPRAAVHQQPHGSPAMAKVSIQPVNDIFIQYIVGITKVWAWHMIKHRPISSLTIP